MASESELEAETRYDAFVSYRHVEPDRRWARWLHAALERYRVPRRLVRERGVPRRLARVFRDEDEVPASADLATEIETALERSRFLVVVCSRRTPESRWIDREVRAFREMGRDTRILALLIEGEPREAFPPSLREVRRRVVGAAGEERLEEVEPLAADVRPRRGESGRRLRRAALLRLVATILGCTYDDLRQREQERTTRRVTAVAAGLLALAAGTGALAALAVRERGRAEVSAADARRALARNLTEQGRQEALAGQPGRALVFLAESVRVDPAADPTRDLLTARAAAAVEAHVATFRIAARAAVSVVASPDGRLAAVVGLDDLSTARKAVVEIVDVATARRIARLEGPTRWVSETAFAPDGRRIATACDDGVARVHDVETGKTLVELDHRGFADTAADREVKAVAYREDGKRIVTACNDGNARTWDPATGALIAVLPGQAKETGGTRFDDRDRVVGAGATAGLRVWDGESGRVIADHGEAGGAWGAPLWSGDGRRGAVVGDSLDGTVIDVTTGETKSLKGRLPVALDLHGETAVVFGEESGLVLKRPGTDDPGRRLLGYEGPLNRRGAFAPDGSRFAGISGRTARLWDAETGELVDVLDGHSAAVFWVAWTPDGTTLLTASEDGTLGVWRPHGAERPRRLPTAILDWGEAFSPDGARVALRGSGGIHLLNLEDGTSAPIPDSERTRSLHFSGSEPRVTRPREPGAPPRAVATPSTRPARSARSWSFLEAAYDVVEVVDAESDVVVARLEGHGDRLLSARFDAARERVVTACQDGLVRVFSPDGPLLASWKVTARGLTCAEFSPDGRRIAVGAQDGILRVLDAETGAVLLSAEDESGVEDVAWSPAGTLLATSPGTGEVRVRDATTGLLLARLWGSATGGTALRWSPNGRWLVLSAPQIGTTDVHEMPRRAPDAATLDRLVREHAAYRYVGGRLVPRGSPAGR